MHLAFGKCGMDVNHKHACKVYCISTTNMATVRKFEVVSDEFEEYNLF